MRLFHAAVDGNTLPGLSYAAHAELFVDKLVAPNEADTPKNHADKTKHSPLQKAVIFCHCFTLSATEADANVELNIEEASGYTPDMNVL